MKNLALAAVFIGLMLGAFSVVLLARQLVSLTNRRMRVSLKSARRGAIVGGSLAFPPSFLLAIAEGGSLGPNWGDFVGGEVAVLIGSTAGIAVLFGLGLAGGVAVGVLLVALAVRLFGSPNAS